MRGCIHKLFVLAVFSAMTAAADTQPYEPAETIHLKARASLAPWWDGTLFIEEIRLSPLRIALSDVLVLDAKNRPCLVIDKMIIDRSTGGIQEIHVYRPSLLVYLEANKTAAKFYSPFNRRLGAPQRSGVILFAIHDASITMINAAGEYTWPHIECTIRQYAPDCYRFSLLSTANKFTANIAVEGRFDRAAGEIEYRILSAHLVDYNESRIFLKAARIPIIVSASAELAANLRASGCINDPNSLAPFGTVHITNVSGFARGGRLFEQGRTIALLSRESIVFDHIAAHGLDGELTGSAYIGTRLGAINKCGGIFKVRDVDLEMLAHALDKPIFTRGKGSATYDFTASTDSIESLRAQALLFLDDADLTGVPVISQLFSSAQLGPADPLAFSDALAYFQMKGPVAQTQFAHISNRLSGIEFQRNTIVDLHNRWIDGYAYIAPLQSVPAFITDLPVISAFVNLKNKLTRVRIRGNWRQPAVTLIKKNIAGDIGSGTLGFFKDILSTGGQIRADVFDKLQTQVYKTPPQK